jgi:O-antigen/teichoic acid export membrane protein
MMEAASQVSGHIRSLIEVFWYKGTTSSLRNRLVRGTVGTLVLRLSAAGLAFLLNVLLARLLGMAEYGVYTYVLSWIGLFSILAIFGLDKLLVRNVAAYCTQRAWGLLSGLLRWTSGVALLMSMGLILLMSSLWPVIGKSSSASQLAVIQVAWILIPLTALSSLRQAVLRGFQRVVSGQLPETLVQPVLAIAVIGTRGLTRGGKLTASQALVIYVVAAGIAFVFGVWLLHKAIPADVKTASPLYQQWAWVLSALPLLLISGLGSINDSTSVLMLGSVRGAEAVGVYAAASRGASLITYILVAANMALAPTFASLYAAGDRVRLQSVVTKSVRLVTLVAAFVALGLVLFGRWFMLLFGHDFARGQAALVILGAGQLVNAAMGSVGLLLIMTGHEREAAIGLGLGAALNVLLNTLWIPAWGAEGAALATASSMILWNVALAWLVWRRLGIYPTALGNIWQRKSK